LSAISDHELDVVDMQHCLQAILPKGTGRRCDRYKFTLSSWVHI